MIGRTSLIVFRELLAKNRQIVTNCQYPPGNQFDKCPKIWYSCHIQPSSYGVICQVMFGRNRRISRYMAAVWVFVLSRVFLCMQYNKCLLLSRNRIQWPLGQDHARSRMIGTVFLAHFSRYNVDFLPVLCIEIIVWSKCHSIRKSQFFQYKSSSISAAINPTTNMKNIRMLLTKFLHDLCPNS